MKRNKSKRTSKDQQNSQAKDSIDDDESYDDTIVRATADYYERHSETRSKDRQLDIWIAVSLYLILSSFAFVAL